MFFKFFHIVLFLYSIIVFPQDRLPILTLESLENCTYTQGPDYVDIKLKNGQFELFEDGIFSYYAGLYLHISCELNGDSLIDAIVVIIEHDRGTGRWQNVFPVLNNSGVPEPLKPFELSDRQDIQRIYKKNKYIYLEVLVHDEHDPMCCPSLRETWKLKFQENCFIQIN